jgi:hypothetical protein
LHHHELFCYGQKQIHHAGCLSLATYTHPHAKLCPNLYAQWHDINGYLWMNYLCLRSTKEEAPITVAAKAKQAA